jgi:hypothetical protein
VLYVSFKNNSYYLLPQNGRKPANYFIFEIYFEGFRSNCPALVSESMAWFGECGLLKKMRIFENLSYC